MPELRKIITLKKLLLFLVFFLIYFLMVIKPYVMMYEGSWQMEADFAKEIKVQYGTALSPEEFAMLKAQKPVYEPGETDIIIAGNPEYTSLQIYSLRELLKLISERKLTLEEENRLWFQLYEEVTSEVVMSDMERLIIFDMWDYYIDSYEQEAIRGDVRYEDLTALANERVKERNQEEVYSPCPGNVAEYNFALLRYFSVFMMLGTTFFVMPYMVSENRSRMPALQCSFKKGRSYYQNRLSAVVGAALVIAIAVCILYAVCAKQDRVFTFWNCPIAGFASGFIGWLPWTLGSYTVSLLLLAILASVGLSLLVFVVTGFLSSYVSAIAWQLPVAAFSCLYGGFLLFKAGEINKPLFIAPAVGIGILAAGLTAVFLQGKWEKKKDMV